MPVALLAGAAGLIAFGFSALSGDDATPTSTPEPAATSAPAATSPLVAPIVDAADVVEDINDNPEVDAALEELGVGPRGEAPVTDPPRVEVVDLTVGAATSLTAADLIKDDFVSVVGASTFKYQLQRGAERAQEIWVDGASGHRELYDGSTYVRFVDGNGYSTTDPSGTWTATETAAPSDPLARLDAFVTIDQVFPEELLDVVTLSTLQGEAGSGRYLIIDTEFAAAAPETRSAWLSTWGLDPSVGPIEFGGAVGGIPDEAASGTIQIAVTTSSDGVVTELVIDAPGAGDVVTYRLLGASTDALTIDAPATIGG